MKNGPIEVGKGETMTSMGLDQWADIQAHHAYTKREGEHYVWVTPAWLEELRRVIVSRPSQP